MFNTVPFSVNVLFPSQGPNPVPLTHCRPPIGMLAWSTEVMAGGGPDTVKFVAAITKSTRTQTVCDPGVVPWGTVKTIWVSLQLTTGAVLSNCT